MVEMHERQFVHDTLQMSCDDSDDMYVVVVM